MVAEKGDYTNDRVGSRNGDITTAQEDKRAQHCFPGRL
jgi:hypothetical protein